jgi:hypothetical protein
MTTAGAQTTAKNRHNYEELASEIKVLSESLTRHMKESSFAPMSDCIANVVL